MKKQIALIGVLVASCLTEQALAYSYKECRGKIIKWNSPSIAMRASPRGFKVGIWRNTLKDAIKKVNLNPSRFRFNLQIATEGVRLNNGQNEIWWSRDAGVLNGAPAIAYSWWTCKRDWRDWFKKKVYLREVDIIFDHRMYTEGKWTGGKKKESLLYYGGSKRLFQGTAVHELGHAMGLGHENREYNIMGADYSHIHANGTGARTYFGEDAGKGAVALYGRRRDEWEDVGVVHWRYSGRSGEYSTHSKSRVFDTDGNVLAIHQINKETGYRVRPGQGVLAEFTFENNGKSRRVWVKVGYYISKNDLITTLDRRIGGAKLRLHRGDVWTRRQKLTIPTDLISGKNYWIGAIVDEDDKISEAVEWNNATYIPIRIN